MQRIKVQIILLCLFLAGTNSYSQLSIANGRIEAGVTFGPTVFLGDLGGNKGKGKPFLKDYDPQGMGLYYGGYLQYYASEWLGFRLQVGAGQLKGSDTYVGNSSTIEVARIYRNLTFRSSMFEGLLMAEIYPTYFLEQTEGSTGKFRPYGLIGVGFLKFDPEGLYKSGSGAESWVRLQPLRTEGQGIPGAVNANKSPYKLNTLVIPMGAGVKYYFSEKVSLGLELIHRKTFTDYLDDVSTVYPYISDFTGYFDPNTAALASYMSGITSYKAVNYPGLNGPNPYPREGKPRGNPKQNDAYFNINFRLAIRFGGSGINNIEGAYYNKRCPSW